jgi:hypothetical protein
MNNMSWKDLENDDPELASMGFEKLNKKIAYLATIKKDGSPRLHPVTAFIGQGMLFTFTEPSSPKIRDLRRDGRYALHCAVGGEGPLIEYLVSGNAIEVSDPSIRAQAESIAGSPVVQDDFVLFEYCVMSVLVIEYDEERKPVVCRWQSVSGN